MVTLNRESIVRIITSPDKKYQQITVKEALKLGATLHNILWELDDMVDNDVKRRRQMFAADCAAHVIHKVDHITKAPRRAIAAARVVPASTAAKAAAIAAVDSVDAKSVLNPDAAMYAGRAAAYAAVGSALSASVTANLAAERVLYDEYNWQEKRLVLWMSDDEPEPYAI
ncbi:MAG: hypothetical protein GY749_22810 [Desulfobacteraceae bacterium]|nr:hypothetical protein [Desulfobacteraceae bacterium]